MQEFICKDSYIKYDFMQDMISLWNIFADDNIQENIGVNKVSEFTKPIIENLEIGEGKSFQYYFQKRESSLLTTQNDDKTVVVCVSGGKDSLAVVLYYINAGYNVILFTVKGINKGYPDEMQSAIEIANYLKLPIIVEEVELKGKKFHIEHPLKNQMICSIAVVYCIENNLPANIAFGDYKIDTYDKSNYGINWTDCYDLWIAYEKFCKNYVPGFKLFIPFYHQNEAIDIISNNKELIPMYQSCMSPIRHRDYLKRTNENKYNIQLLNKRCGSCRKCCAEYIDFCDKGIFEFNKEFYEHCLDIVKKKSNEYFGKEISVRTYKEIYELFFMRKFESSAYYNSVSLTNRKE